MKNRVCAFAIPSFVGSVFLVASLAIAQVDTPSDQKEKSNKTDAAANATGQTTDQVNPPADRKATDTPRADSNADRTLRPDQNPNRANPDEQTQSQRPDRQNPDRDRQNPDRSKARTDRTENADAARTADPAGRRDRESTRENASEPRGSGGDDRQRGERAQLGLEFDQRSDAGLTITSIDEGGIAANTGLRVGDRIVSVDGRRIANPRQLEAYLTTQSNRRVPVIIDRGGRLYTVQFQSIGSESQGAWLGVYLQDSEDNQQSGAQITSVYPASPAARAGLRTGDVIVSVNSQRITGTPDLISTIDQLEPRSRAELVVLRGNREVTVPVVLGERDSYVAYYGERDDRFDREGEGDEDYGRDQEDFPPHAMQLEHDRRNAEQHQRIEAEIRKLQEEVRKLRELIEQRN